jgi:hypothetical protein
MWLATPSSCDSFIHCTSPVFIGAPEHFAKALIPVEDPDVVDGVSSGKVE